MVRNGGKKIYDPNLADEKAFWLRVSKAAPRGNKIDEDKKLQKKILQYLQKGLAPEAMVGRSIRENVPLGVSHPTIYAYIYKYKSEWIKYLPYRKEKKYRSQKASKDMINQTKMNISQHCEEANFRKEIHHYEIDTIHLDKGAILTIVDRKSRYLATALLPNRTRTANSRRD